MIDFNQEQAIAGQETGVRRIVQVIAAAALACVLVAGCAAQTSVGRKPAAEGTDIATFLGDEEISHLLDGYESDAPQMMVVTQGNGMAATVASTRTAAPSAACSAESRTCA